MIEISLAASGHAPPALPPKAYDPEQDSILSLLGDICEAWEGHAAFHVLGFGPDPWPVDVRTDLPVFMAGLPVALRRFRAGRDFVLDFYEQGFACHLRVEAPARGLCRIRIDSFGDWPPDPAPIEVDAAALMQQLDVSFQEVVHLV